MKRDLDFHFVRHEHLDTHERLTNWSCWQRVGRLSSYILPMFRFYRDGYFEHAESTIPVDEVDALKVQRAFAKLPDRHRHAIGWAYTKPWIPVHIACRLMVVRKSDLCALIHDGRSMLKNTCEKRLTGKTERC